MKPSKSLTVLLGIALLVVITGCSTTSPVEVAPTPNIEATVEARLAQERTIDARVEARLKESSQPTATPTPSALSYFNKGNDYYDDRKYHYYVRDQTQNWWR